MMIEVLLPGTNLYLKGEPNDVANFFKEQGVDLTASGEYYLSSSLGLMKVEDMEANHLKNALRKEWKRWVDELYLKPMTNKELVYAMTDFHNNKLLMKMICTLAEKND